MRRGDEDCQGERSIFPWLERVRSTSGTAGSRMSNFWPKRGIERMGEEESQAAEPRPTASKLGDPLDADDQGPSVDVTREPRVQCVWRWGRGVGAVAPTDQYWGKGASQLPVGRSPRIQ